MKPTVQYASYWAISSDLDQASERLTIFIAEYGGM